MGDLTRISDVINSDSDPNAGNSENEISELKRTISELRGRISEMEKEQSGKINALKIESAINLELYKAGAKNVKAVRGLMPLPETFELDSDGNVKGLGEAISRIKRSDGYLFEDKSEIGFSGILPAESEGNLPDFSRMTYSEISDFIAKNPGIDLGGGAML